MDKACHLHREGSAFPKASRELAEAGAVPGYAEAAVTAERGGPLPGHPFPLEQISAVSENSWGGGILAKRRVPGQPQDDCNCFQVDAPRFKEPGCLHRGPGRC